MSFPQSDRVARINDVSRRGAIDSKSRSDAVSLSKGEPDFDSPRPVLDAMVAALGDGWTHYVPMTGLPELREKISSVVNAQHDATYETENVLITHGGTAGITSTILATVDAGRSVIVADPTYSLYTDAIALAGGQQVTVPVDPEDPTQGVSALAAAAREHNAAMVILCNPVNPTGAVLSHGVQEKLARELEGTDCLVLSDEAYQDFLYTDTFSSALAVTPLRDRLIYVQTFSKTFAMTGWRVGYVIAPHPVIDSISTVHKIMNGSINSAVQVAAIKALETHAETVPPMIDEYRERRKLMLEGLSAVPGIHVTAPEAAFYVFIRYDLDLPSERLRQILSQEYGLELRAGSEYGDNGEQHLRISYAYSREALGKAITILDRAFRELMSRDAEKNTLAAAEALS